MTNKAEYTCFHHVSQQQRKEQGNFLKHVLADLSLVETQEDLVRFKKLEKNISCEKTDTRLVKL